MPDMSFLAQIDVKANNNDEKYSFFLKKNLSNSRLECKNHNCERFFSQLSFFKTVPLDKKSNYGICAERCRTQSSQSSETTFYTVERHLFRNFFVSGSQIQIGSYQFS